VIAHQRDIDTSSAAADIQNGYRTSCCMKVARR
jgi:hypothetical protein